MDSGVENKDDILKFSQEIYDNAITYLFECICENDKEKFLKDKLLELCELKNQIEINEKKNMIKSLICMSCLEIDNLSDTINYEICINETDEELRKKCENYNKEKEQKKIEQSMMFYYLVYRLLENHANNLTAEAIDEHLNMANINYVDFKKFCEVP